ncbi:MAG: hypothetical protein AAF434_01145 [Pseudomonadota bacterium]
MKILISTLTLVSLFIATTVFGAPLRLETQYSVIELPDTWEIKDLSSEAILNGPKNVTLKISVIRITGFKIASGGTEADWRRSRKEFGAHVLNRIQNESKSSDLKVVSNLKETESLSSYPIWEIKTETKDGLRFFYLYGVVGKKAVMNMALEGKIGNESTSAEVLSAINNIEWK